MACQPQLLVLDEPTTGLDVTAQAQIAELVKTLVTNDGTAAIWVSHDLALLGTVCDDIAVMYGGEVVERAPAEAMYRVPRHPYTRALLDAVPLVDRRELVAGISGLPPSEVIDDRCPFAERCRFTNERCWETHPVLAPLETKHFVRCLRASELGLIPSARRAIVGGNAPAQTDTDRLVVSDLSCSYRGTHKLLAVDDVSVRLAAGETLGIVGESGSGKSTLLRAIAGLHQPESGTIALEGLALAPQAARRPKEVRQAIQLVFQNPDSSLNPRQTVAEILTRPLKLFRRDLGRQARLQRMRELIADVRLDPIILGRFPPELSGGQRQRVALARAFAAQPTVLLCDEVNSALDVSVQAAILGLIRDLAVAHGTSVVFVTHDLAVVRSLADRICVMWSGRVVESSTNEELFEHPTNPYTQKLLLAVPRLAFPAAPSLPAISP
jgi:peptide/nickel transport system ATP-binding protein